MPLSINVGLSRKASRDYQSTGYSINVTAELDQSLLARPEELQAQIDGLYAQAAAAIDRQAGASDQQHQQTQRTSQQPYQGNGRSYGNGNGRPSSYGNANGSGNGNGNGYSYSQGNGNGPSGRRSNGGGMTDSQRKAINAIARRIGADPQYEAEQIIGKGLEQLSVRDASSLIDHLKSLQPNTGNGRDGGGQ